MLLDKPYCSLADVQRETKSSDPALDSIYNSAITAASRWVEQHCHRDFWYHEYTEENPYVVPRSRVLGHSIFLPFPILRVDDIWVYSYSETGKTDNDKLEAGEYYFNTSGYETYTLYSRYGDFAPYTSPAEAHTGNRYQPYYNGNNNNPSNFPSNYENTYHSFVELAGCFGYELDTENPDTTPPLTIPAGIGRATAIIASAWSGQLSKDDVGLDGVVASVLDTKIPSEAYKLLKPWVQIVESAI